jgi:phospholipase A1
MKSLVLMILMGLVVSAVAATNNFQEVANPKQGISVYKPNYVMLGTDPILEMKLQLSIKYRFVEEGTFGSWWSAPANDVFFAYSQKTFWDLEENSAPYPNTYIDNYFNPEVFWLKRDLSSSLWNSQFDLQFGYQHESNGRGNEENRSWDRIYLQPYWIWGETGGYQFVVTPMLWFPYFEGDSMQDIEEYYGYGELRLKFGKHDGLSIDTMLRKGTKDWNGAVELSASYPIRPINVFVYGQIFHGYGETLRLYNEETTSYRLGFAISR